MLRDPKTKHALIHSMHGVIPSSRVRLVRNEFLQNPEFDHGGESGTAGGAGGAGGVRHARRRPEQVGESGGDARDCVVTRSAPRKKTESALRVEYNTMIWQLQDEGMRTDSARKRLEQLQNSLVHGQRRSTQAASRSCWRFRRATGSWPLRWGTCCAIWRSASRAAVGPAAST